MGCPLRARQAEAVGYDSSEVIVRTVVETTGPAAKLQITKAHSNTEVMVALSRSSMYTHDTIGRAWSLLQTFDFEIDGAATLLESGTVTPPAMRPNSLQTIIQRLRPINRSAHGQPEPLPF